METRSLPSFALEAYFARWEFAARYHLTASDGQTLTVRELLELVGADPAELLDLPLGYLPTWGTADLRESVAAHYAHAAPGDVLPFAGAEEGMFWTLAELLRPGDHAVVTVPNYQALESVPAATGADLTGVPLWEPDPGSPGDVRWVLDVDRVAAAMRPTTRVVAVNVPNNPTGLVPPHADWQALADLCDRRGVHLFSDEVYRGVEADPTATLTPAADLLERGISLDVTSKSLGLPGLRVGWIVTRDRDLLTRLEGRKHWTSICNAGPSELLAALAVRNAGALRARLRGVIEENVPLVDAFMARHPDLFTWRRPDGGCVAYPRYLGEDGVEAFCADLVEQAGVLLLPASVYPSALAPPPSDRFRIGVGRRGIAGGLAAMEEFLAGRRAPARSPA